MTTQHLARQLLTIRHLVAVTEARCVTAESVLAVILADGYPGGSDGVRGGASSTATEAAVIARQRYDDDWRDMQNTLIRVTDLLRHVCNIADRYHVTDARHAAADAKAKARCTGGMPSLETWTRPECQNLVGERSEHGLCDACRQRRDHWARRQQEVRA